MAIYPLAPIMKGSKTLNPHSSFYTKESAQRMCSWYLESHLTKDANGKLYNHYRLHSTEPRTFADFMAYDINCPKCGKRMHPVANALDHYTLAMYTCSHCNKK